MLTNQRDISVEEWRQKKNICIKNPVKQGGSLTDELSGFIYEKECYENYVCTVPLQFLVEFVRFQMRHVVKFSAARI